MKIVFMCGSLEPGRDGVGDYVRILATELNRAGVAVAAVAMYDKFVTQEVIEIQSFEAGSLNVLRLPLNTSDTTRFEKIKQYVNQHNPDWLSLQFVPYAFDSKGLPFKLGKYLSKIGKQRKWHIMFHELWLSKPEKATQFIVSILQRVVINRLLKQLSPQLINVSIEFNKGLLKKMGFPVEVLRIYGNIIKRDTVKLPDVILKDMSHLPKLLYFGGPPRGTFLHQVIDGIADFIESSKLRIELVVVMGPSAAKNLFIEKLNDLKDNIIIREFSELENDTLSILISSCNAGIVRSEPHMLGKSGTAIAMLEHGLPIWLPKMNKTKITDFDFRNDLIFNDLKDCLDAKPQKNYHSLLPETASLYYKQLNQFK